MIPIIRLVLACTGAVLSMLGVPAVAAEGPPPANDTLAGAQVIHNLPATIGGTTVGASVEPLEAADECAPGSEHTVWYALRTPTAERVAVNLAASGALDASVEVFHAVRSQLERLGCQASDSHGRAALTFKSSKNGLYDIRVAAKSASQLAGFTLEVFLPTPAVGPPGPRLPAGGAAGKVDRIQNINAAYSTVMHAGVSYLVNLTNRTPGACVSGGLFAPGTSSFEGSPALLHITCGGYRLFTPGPGEGGVYSFQVIPRSSFKRVQRFHLEVAPAGPAETAPGIGLGNYGHAHGSLNGNGVRVLRLYRLDIATHSNLSLRLLAAQSADFNLQLRNLNGQVIECQCGSSGSQTLTHQLAPGRYYAVVSARGATQGTYTLIRQSRTITRTSVSFSASKATAGQALGIDVKIAPAVSGPVTVDIERFDPVFGWQFYRRQSASASGGSATVAFTPPAVGRWRANASYAGSRTAGPSAVGFAYLLVS